MTTSPEQQPDPVRSDDQDAAEDERREQSRTSGQRLLAFSVLMLGSLMYLLVANVPVISYSYDPLLRQTSRIVNDRSFFDIWAAQVQNLPSASPQWVVDSMFLVSLVVVCGGVIYGAWMLMVSSESSVKDDISNRIHRYRAR